MVRRERRAFTPEFKAEAVRMVREQGISLSQTCRDLDLCPAVLRRWLDKSKSSPSFSISSHASINDSEKAELERLRSENRQLKMEREILKKATAFFAREST